MKRKRLNTNINTNISNTFDNEENETRITFNDKTFPDIEQELLAQEFLQNYIDKYNLYIFPNIYESDDKKLKTRIVSVTSSLINIVPLNPINTV
jgi:hypothetical protein